MITATSRRLDPAIIRQKLSLSQEKLSSLLKVSSKTVIDRSTSLARQIQERIVYRFDVRLEGVLNLCQPEVWQELSLGDAPNCF
jgi:hypothetical protein